MLYKLFSYIRKITHNIIDTQMSGVTHSNSRKRRNSQSEKHNSEKHNSEKHNSEKHNSENIILKKNHPQSNINNNKSKYNNFVKPGCSQDSWLIDSKYYTDLIVHIINSRFDNITNLEILVPGAGVDPSTIMLAKSFHSHKFIVVDHSPESREYFEKCKNKNIIFHGDWNTIENDHKFDLILDKSFSDVLIANDLTKFIQNYIHNKLNVNGLSVSLSMHHTKMIQVLNQSGNEDNKFDRFYGVMFDNQKYKYPKMMNKRQRCRTGIVSIGIMQKLDNNKEGQEYGSDISEWIKQLNKYIYSYFDKNGMEAFKHRNGSEQDMFIQPLDEDSKIVPLNLLSSESL